MFLTIKLYLHLNCALMQDWIVWNWTVFDIETVLYWTVQFCVSAVLTFNCDKICTYSSFNWQDWNCLNKLNSLKWKCFWQLNCVLMLNWDVWNRTICIKMDLPLNNLQRLICHKPNRPTNQASNKLSWYLDGWLFKYTFSQLLGQALWYNGYGAEVQLPNKWVRTPLSLLRSLSN